MRLRLQAGGSAGNTVEIGGDELTIARRGDREPVRSVRR